MTSAVRGSWLDRAQAGPALVIDGIAERTKQVAPQVTSPL
jgi:hypothetical protein